jgi:hypothetical protein
VGAGWIGLGCDMADVFEDMDSICAADWWSMEQGLMVIVGEDCSEGGVLEET